MKTFIEKHRLLKRPFAEIVLWQLGGYLVTMLVIGVIAGIVGALAKECGVAKDVQSTIENSVIILGGLLMLVFFRMRYRPCFKGFGWVKNCARRDIVCLTLVAIGVDVVLCIIDLRKLGTILVPSFSTVVAALEPGIVEEIADRMLPLAAAMYVFKDRRSAAAPLILTAILFGATHLPNIFEGADVGITILQAFSAGAGGIFMGALYIRTGSFLPGMLVHTLHDFMGFLMHAPGALTGTVEVWDIAEVVILAVVHLIVSYLLMRGSADKVRAVWNRIWVEEKLEAA